MTQELASERIFGQMNRQMAKMMEHMQKGMFGFCGNDVWVPSVNLYENQAAYLVCVDLAGIDKEKLDLEVTANQLRLKGHRTAPTLPEPTAPAGAGQNKLRVHLMEIDHGSFCREVDLPDDIDRANVSASYVNGMLWIELPKKRA